ncbi:unnamed protein product [Adineta steineri]|uniref:Uncharacterized protein n=1 Tax=Adineta steineri TaxID=433720 RepID=A0A819S7K5_9BILA|nr:unnamed protein product [Adineta steineri]
MNIDVEVDSSVCEHATIQARLVVELQKLQDRKFPQGFSRPVHVLKAVYDKVNGDWEQRLQQTTQCHINECIVLIPYDLGNFDWIGILIEFKRNRQIQRAEFIDPVKYSKVVCDKIQQEFHKFYPGVVLFSKRLQTHEDSKQSAQMTIENLIKMVEESLLIEESHDNIDNSCRQISDDQQNRTFLNEDNELEWPQHNSCIETLSEVQGNKPQFNNSQTELSNIRETLVKKNRRHFLKRQSCTEQQIEEHETPRVDTPSEIKGNYFDSFSTQLIATKKIHNTTNNGLLSLTDSPVQYEQYESLKEQLRVDLYEHETNDEKELKEEIIKKKQEIESLQVQQKFNIVRKRQVSLSKLEKLQQLADKIRAYEYQQKISKLEEIKEKLASGLLERDVSNEKELKEEIIKKKQEIETLEKRGKHKTVIKRQESLTTLEQLVDMIDKIKGLELFYSIDTLDNLKTSLIDGLLEHDISDEKELGKELINRKLEIEILRNTGKYETAEKRRNSLLALEELEALNYKIKALQTSYLSQSHEISNSVEFSDRSHSDEITIGRQEDMTITKDSNSNLKHITTTPFARSETQCIAPVRVYFKDIGGYSNESIVLCDSPGFEDTSGPEVDIANGIGIVKAIRECKSVKPVVLISYKSIGDRLGGVKDLAHTLVKLVPEIEDYIKTFSYIFTKFPSTEKGTICALLTNAEETLNETDKSDIAFTSLFSDMINKTRQGARALDPINDDAFEILRELVESETITYPDEVFKFFITSKSKAILQEQISVLWNNFDESAEHIKKIYESLSILQDHLDFEDMKRKYNEMKEYFLDYLNNIVEKLNYLFDQEKLNKNDIENLNICICTLENVRNTFPFQSHISKKVIDQIYENFLSKILNHLQEIIKKIHRELEKENIFHILEEFLIELDSLRTISIIEHKTDQAYYKLLEKIVEYVYNSKIHIEQLFQREEKMNYDKLRNYLFSLKNAQWVEKYRIGVYSNVMNDIEEQFIEYIKETKRSIMKISLDLDNSNKIDFVYKLILEINQMKQFEEIFIDINQYLSDINFWFDDSINQVCDLIRNLSDIEILKEQKNKNLDLNKIEQAFCYLNVCKTINISSKNNYLLVLNNLEEFIRYYSEIVQKEMNNSFRKIEQFQNENKEEIFENVCILSNYLQEIYEIKTKYSRIFSCLINQKIFEYWQQELTNYLHELSDEMKRLSITRQIVILKNQLSIVKILSRLDRFFEGEKYIDIYNKYQSEFLIKLKYTSEKIVDSIQKYDYQQISHEMLTLKLCGDVGEHFFRTE